MQLIWKMRNANILSVTANDTELELAADSDLDYES